MQGWCTEKYDVKAKYKSRKPFTTEQQEEKNNNIERVPLLYVDIDDKGYELPPLSPFDIEMKEEF